MESIKELLNKIKTKIIQVITIDKSSELLENEIAELLLRYKKIKDESKTDKSICF
jgi:hypothetical protein